jgi:hypothetical protein
MFDMKYLLVRDEKNISDVADRAYTNLSDKARKKAEDDLLKANPELKTFKSVSKGFIVRIPETIDGGEKHKRNLTDPVDAIANEILDNLKRYEKSLGDKFTALEQRQKADTEILKAANKELKTQPNGEAAAKTLSKYLSDSKKLNDKKLKLGLEALEKLQETAQAMNR